MSFIFKMSFQKDILRLTDFYYFSVNIIFFIYIFSAALLDNMPVMLADEDKLSPMEQSSSSADDR